MPTTTDLAALAEQLPAQRLGDVLRSARWAAGLSRNEVEAATNELVPARVLGWVERGRRRPSHTQLELLDELYGVDLSRRLGPARVTPIVDLESRRLEIGWHFVELYSLDDLHVLGRYLEVVSDLRGTIADDLVFRVEDLDALGTSLHRSRKAVQSDLRTLLRRRHAVAHEAPEDSTSFYLRSPSAELVSFGVPRLVAPAEPTTVDRRRLVELDAVRDARFAPSTMRDRLLTRSTRSDRQRALRVRERELLGDLGFATWSSMLIAIARAEAIVPDRDGRLPLLALGPGSTTEAQPDGELVGV